MKKVFTAAMLLAGLAFSASSAFAWDYIWPVGAAHSNSLAYRSKLTIDDYLPWQSGGSAKALGMAGAYTAVADDLGGAVEYNPAGLTQLGHINATLLVHAQRATAINPATGKKESEWDTNPTYAGASVKLGPLALAVSRKQPESVSTFRDYGRKTQRNIFAPDGWRMYYNKFSENLDMSDLNTMVLTGALKISKLSVGANINKISGEIKRVQSGRRTSLVWSPTNYNNRFDLAETVKFDGYTMDLGAMLDMGILKLGASAKNFQGSVDITRRIVWQDNFDVGAGNTWNWMPASKKETLTKFAPTYSAGAALELGKILIVDMDYVTTSLEDSSRATGKLGAQLAVIPGFLFARGGVQSDFKNLVGGVKTDLASGTANSGGDGEDQKTRKYFVGAGLKMAVLTVDAAASLEEAQSGSGGGNMSGAVSASLKF